MGYSLEIECLPGRKSSQFQSRGGRKEKERILYIYNGILLSQMMMLSHILCLEFWLRKLTITRKNVIQ